MKHAVHGSTQVAISTITEVIVMEEKGIIIGNMIMTQQSLWVDRSPLSIHKVMAGLQLNISKIKIKFLKIWA
jgi:hypothetical protein